MKKTSPLILILAITLGTYLNGSTLDAADNPKASVFKHLKKGQIVTLKDNGHNYSIQVLPNLPIGHKIVEIGSDYRSQQGFSGREQWDPLFDGYSVCLILGAVAWWAYRFQPLEDNPPQEPSTNLF